jgi:hypothetical protein
MRAWWWGFLRAWAEIGLFVVDRIALPWRGLPTGERMVLLLLGVTSLGGTLVLSQVMALPSLPIPSVADLDVVTRRPRPTPPPVGPLHDLHQPVRAIPPNFRLSQAMPRRMEAEVSLPIDRVDFNVTRDLVRVYDPRVWWESEHDDHTGDVEDDHLMHWSVEEPFRRLVELVVREGGLLKVQDIYRAEGIHKAASLHKQGRAVDLTSEKMSLGRLAALTYAAGFDWVLYERGGGHHVHASVNPKGRRRLQ